MTGYKMHNGERLEVYSSQTRDNGHGEQVKVRYEDGTEGWEHWEDIMGENNEFPIDKPCEE